MPTLPKLEAESLWHAPKGPHLAVYLPGEERFLPVTEGATVYIVEDATDVRTVYPLQLVKVRHDKLTFRMVGSDGAVTEYQYRLSGAKPLNKQAVQRLAKGGKLASG